MPGARRRIFNTRRILRNDGGNERMSELLNLIDGQVEIEEDVTLFVDGQEQKQEWKITDDTTADWWIERKQEELKDIERLKEQIRAKIDFYQSRLDAECKKEEFIKGDMNSRLIEYFESIPDDQKKKTKTLVKYQLPTGTLQKKFKSPTYIKDDEELFGPNGVIYNYDVKG